MLARHGAVGDERFWVWAGTANQNEAFVSTVVTPRVEAGYMHGEVPAGVSARLFEALDTRDLVPLAQVHSHPKGPGMSRTDRELSLVAVPGFWSIIIPEFGFTWPTNVSRRGVYEYKAKRDWHILTGHEKSERIDIDDSVIQVD
jgi:proteasome lid subunit RPN8/RPN11